MYSFRIDQQGREVVVHAFNPSTWEAEEGVFLSLRSAWTTEWVPGQPGLHRETMSQNKTKQNESNFCMMVRTFNPSTQQQAEAEAGGSLEVQVQPCLHSEPRSPELHSETTKQRRVNPGMSSWLVAGTENGVMLLKSRDARAAAGNWQWQGVDCLLVPLQRTGPCQC